MQRYTLLSLRNGMVTDLTCVSAKCDVCATEAAWKLAEESYCELWEGERLIAFIERTARSEDM